MLLLQYRAWQIFHDDDDDDDDDQQLKCFDLLKSRRNCRNSRISFRSSWLRIMFQVTSGACRLLCSKIWVPEAAQVRQCSVTNNEKSRCLMTSFPSLVARLCFFCSFVLLPSSCLFLLLLAIASYHHHHHSYHYAQVLVLLPLTLLLDFYVVISCLYCFTFCVLCYDFNNKIN